jgi:hypothetical protein
MKWITRSNSMTEKIQFCGQPDGPLRAGIEVSVNQFGPSFSRNGEALYLPGVYGGNWSSGGFRQHGIKGRP